MPGSRPLTGLPLRIAAAVVVLAFVLPVVLSSAGRAVSSERSPSWFNARNDSSGQAPPAASTPEAVVQVYAARTFGWRGAFGVHTWFALKPAGADAYTRAEVIGWQYYHAGEALRLRRGTPDGYWFGNRPTLLLDLRGDRAEALIGRILAAAEHYPHRQAYRVWPGPNSNTFTAYIARQVPELRLDLPPNAVGKDFLVNGALIDDAPSGTGKQISLFGLLGILVGREEGIEVNVLGLTAGIDFSPPALKLPGLGRVGMPAVD